MAPSALARRRDPDPIGMDGVRVGLDHRFMSTTSPMVQAQQY